MVLAWLLAAGCSAATVPPASDSLDVMLDAPEAKVRAAFVRVLTDGGYEVESGADRGSAIRTGFRTEIGNYNWLYRTRFGVNRSKVSVTLSPEGDAATRVTVQVWSEGKDGEWMPLTRSWVAYDTAVPQSAANTIRLVKNELGLL
jgi:hypothetical protein